MKNEVRNSDMKHTAIIIHNPNTKKATAKYMMQLLAQALKEKMQKKERIEDKGDRI